MKGTWGWLLVALLLALPTLAQDDAAIPQAVVDVALDTVEAQRGSRTENYRFQLLGRTTSSALGCPLVEGETLPFEVTPYRVEVIYPDGIYVVHVSADARYVQLCDPKFGDAMTSPANPETLENACRLTPNAAVPVYVAPSESVPGVQTAAVGEAVRVYGRSSDNAWYQIAAGQGTGWIQAENATLSGDCADLNATGFTVPTQEGSGAVCFVSALGAFANVRSQPTTDSVRVARIFENAQYQVTARNTAGDWFYIQPGWVAGSVINTVGDCINLTVSDRLVGVGFTEDLPGELDESVSRALAEYPCTVDFEGYLEPRLQIGNANAQVEVGGLPNALRSFPSVDDNESQNIGTIQPGRTIDRVIAGPVCNQGFVWWLVEFDGQTGWTAESNQSSDDYFLEPLSGSVDPVPDAESNAETEEGASAGGEGLREGQNQEFVQTWRQGENPVTQIVFSADGSRLYTLSRIPGFGDGVQGEVAVWNSDGSEIVRLTAAAEILGIGLDDAANTLLVADASGGVTLFDATSLEQTATYPALFDASFAHETEVAFHAGATTLLAASGCTDASCATSQVSVYDLDAGTRLWSAEYNNQDITALAFSNDAANLQLAASSEAGVIFWNAADGSVRSTFDGNGLRIYDIAFNSDDSRLLAVGCSECDATGSIALLDGQTGALLGVAQGHRSAARLVAFAPDDASLVSSDGVRQIMLRDAVSGELQGMINVPDVTLTALTYDPATGLPVFGTDNGWIVAVRYTGDT